MRRKVAKAYTGDAGPQWGLSVSYEKMGNVLVAQGNLPEALKSYRDDLAISDRLAKADSSVSAGHDSAAACNSR